MSLYKTYRLECDGTDLARRLGVFLGMNPEHELVSPGAESAAEARRRAKGQDWVRVTREFPISVSTSSAGTSAIAFDLCPACARHLEGR